MPVIGPRGGVGALRDAVRIERKQDTGAGDGAGNFEAAWEPIEGLQQRAAAIEPVRGGESVIADRLTGVRAFNIWLRVDADSLKITAGHRVVDVDDASRIFAIRFAEPMDVDRQWLLLQCEEGVAD